jgi:prolipoprotein diacylglyceryl transferase
MNAAFVRWNVDPEILSIGDFSLRYYGVLFAAGIIACLYFLKSIFKEEGIALEKLDTLTIYGVLGIFVGARLGHCLFYDPSYYLNHPLEMVLPIQQTQDGALKFVGYQGLASHGGVAGLIVALVLYSQRTKESIIRTIDLISVAAPLAGCFIRLGNLMNSEIVGLPSDVSWAFVFERVDELPRHPAQLYEAVAYLVIFLLVFYLYKMYRAQLQNGSLFGISLTLVFIARFIIEFLKERQVSFEEQMQLDMGQWLSLPFILVGLGFLAYGLTAAKRLKRDSTS